MLVAISVPMHSTLRTEDEWCTRGIAFCWVSLCVASTRLWHRAHSRLVFRGLTRLVRMPALYALYLLYLKIRPFIQPVMRIFTQLQHVPVQILSRMLDPVRSFHWPA